MKKTYPSMSGFNPAEFDNWLEVTTMKTFKHAKMGKNKFWSDSEGDRTNRKKKRGGRSPSPYS